MKCTYVKIFPYFSVQQGNFWDMSSYQRFPWGIIVFWKIEEQFLSLYELLELSCLHLNWDNFLKPGQDILLINLHLWTHTHTHTPSLTMFFSVCLFQYSLCFMHLPVVNTTLYLCGKSVGLHAGSVAQDEQRCLTLALGDWLFFGQIS